ncbi:hypothetical protein KQI63_06110 [bacterium]|nr:hypothetical protein [bacterium]
MKYLTRNLILFGLVTIALSLLFHFRLHGMLLSETYGGIWWIAFAYAGAMFLNGFFFGMFDPQRKSRVDLGFMYHLVTFVVVIPIWLGMIFFGPAKGNFLLWIDLNIMVVWAVVLLMHFLKIRKQVKGYSPDKAFE